MDRSIAKSRIKKTLLWGLVIIYVLSPFDLLPEALMGIVGILDDIGLLAYAFARTLGIKPYVFLKSKLFKTGK
jgi:uncharacterized membrane protein YkvA (DUF1232 family)